MNCILTLTSHNPPLLKVDLKKIYGVVLSLALKTTN